MVLQAPQKKQPFYNVLYQHDNIRESKKYKDEFKKNMDRLRELDERDSNARNGKLDISIYNQEIRKSWCDYPASVNINQLGQPLENEIKLEDIAYHMTDRTFGLL